MAETSVLSRVLQAIQNRNHASVRGILATVSIEEIEAEVGKVRFSGAEVDPKQISYHTWAVDHSLTMVAALIAA